ncbi:Sorting and assembly machinery component 50-like protein [Cryptotermes secundus]|uniref:Sorting and assembly machinery component 50-like protein n=1 Tax=Cryptotermes secundus TaxID=105785 RepID=A0A2J7RT80_9NEOP|nr:sorting and assembly machinery component 50 homolog isoform X2 [Cryptotermes secundus]PNF44042.1 Sorting and assembly machinery component 50-like protein [Cryptotermes secundus]
MGTVHCKGERDHYESDKGQSTEQKQINLDGVKARVDKIYVDGLSRTKDDIIIATVRDLFQAKDFQEVIVGAHKVRGKLEGLGCFRNIGIYIDTSSGPHATPEGVEVTFYVRELKRIVGGVSTLVGNNEGSLVVQMRLPNIFGRGEKLQTEYSYGSQKTSTFNLSFTKPLQGNLNPVFTGTVFQAGSEWPSSGYKQIERGLLLDFGFNSTPLVRHNLQWEGAWRDISCMSRSAAFQVREQTGPSLKSSVRHILTFDCRDAPILPTCGSLIKLTQEFAGLGGNIGFFKNDLCLQSNWTLLADMVVQATLQAGFLTRINNSQNVGICDQFFLGGPLSLRGFQARGVGPHKDGNALGANAYWSGGLHLFTPLPFSPGKGGLGDFFRTHLFVSAGNLDNVYLGKEMPTSFQTLMRTVRMAYGIGVALRLGQMGRIELNYCIPVLYRREDQPNHGVQFGIGVHFP